MVPSEKRQLAVAIDIGLEGWPRTRIAVSNMAIKELHISGYRSVRDVCLSLGMLNVLTGT